MTAPTPQDRFEGYSPIPGMEHAGRAIVDQYGEPSGSPANYENFAGSPHPDGWPAIRQATAQSPTLDAVKALFAPRQVEVDEVRQDPETPGDVPIVRRVARGDAAESNPDTEDATADRAARAGVSVRTQAARDRKAADGGTEMTADAATG